MHTRLLRGKVSSVHQLFRLLFSWHSILGAGHLHVNLSNAFNICLIRSQYGTWLYIWNITIMLLRNWNCMKLGRLQIYLLSWEPLWSRGQSSWLQIQRSEFDSRRYQIFWEVVGLEWGPLSLVSTIEELLERKNSGSGVENREYGRRDLSRWPRDTPVSA
jgi:hypothetical protein